MACTSIILKGIASDCQTSKGGIRRAWVKPWSEGLFALDGRIKDNTSGQTSGITYTVTGLTTATGWLPFEFRKNTGSMVSTYNIDDANGVNYVSSEVVLVFAKQDTAKRIELSSLALSDIALIVEDCNGERYALGIDEPVRMSAGTGETGTNKTDGNKYSVTLLDEFEEFPPMLASSVVINPPNVED